MNLHPRYGSDPIIAIEGELGAAVGPTVRQRRRLAELVAGFDDERWAAPTRCAGWSARDVIVHLHDTNGFWVAALDAGRHRRPTRILADFDPVATPPLLVAANGGSGAEVAEQFAASTEALATLLGELSPDDLAAPAEAPPGHVAAGVVVHHALWDSWVHERDILLPQGVDPVVAPDEVAAALRYAAALGPAVGVLGGEARSGTLAVAATDPAEDFTVAVGHQVRVTPGGDDGGADLHLAGDAVDLLEALSVRRPLDRAVPPAAAWMLAALTEAFETAPDAAARRT